MHAKPPIRRLTQLTSAVMVGCLIYQLGACPCGCLEHNYWLGLMGLADHEPITTASTASAVGGTHDDDCLDHQHGPYFDTSPRVEPAVAVSGNAAISNARVNRSTFRVGGDFRLDRGPPTFGNTPRHDSLQVYRL